MWLLLDALIRRFSMTAEKNNGGPGIYAALVRAQKFIAITGIPEDARNDFNRFDYRSIKGLVAGVVPALIDSGLTVCPRVISCDLKEIKTSSGKQSFSALVHVSYLVTYDGDGSLIEGSVFGYGVEKDTMAVRYAMTAAYKTFLEQLFCISHKGLSEGGEVADDEGAPKSEALPPYPEDKFLDNVGVWEKAISEGRTPQDVISAISSRFTLTSLQKDVIKSLTGQG
jgi:hypothetical protein